MGKGTSFERLQRDSPSYRAYLELEKLPDRAPAFENDEDGLPRIAIGEHFCRVLGDDRLLCGARLSNTNALRTHLEVVHQTDIKKPGMGSKNTTAMFKDAEAFYARLMEDHDAPEVVVEEAKAPARKTLGKRKSIVIDLTDEITEPDANEHIPLQPTTEPPTKKSLSTAHPKQKLEFELKKIALRKKMHADELRELDVQEELAELEED
ncbi:hypothetical protein CB0940_05996 [Cercospora beticola]|uniref:Uncharacterized protein n=1 Tax=Cercospora beticola TaxID=122368 RepID=A0A2G5HYL4_CERBT|nr:hypothetical protein CB0940_05996 [Cercospora beticola]PIA97635.1 hypothetical protein CB0940_05996 [Cercospora beticola]WPA98600.1 hypothetical protein RHO25_003212 [Cercospora beticola]